MHTSLCVCRMSHSALKEYVCVCVFFVCVCVLVCESGCRNQVKRKSNTWLNRGISARTCYNQRWICTFHMRKCMQCMHLRFCMFAHVLTGFINDLTQCQVTRAGYFIFLCVWVSCTWPDSVRTSMRTSTRQTRKMNWKNCNTQYGDGCRDIITV